MNDSSPRADAPGADRARHDRSRTDRPTPTARGAAVLLAGVGAFQVALVAGAPWGAAAWGGANPGVLPPGYRVASGIAALVYAGLAFTAGATRLPAATRRRTLTGASVLMMVGTAANLASPSLVEKVAWTPVAASLAVLLWRSR